MHLLPQVKNYHALEGYFNIDCSISIECLIEHYDIARLLANRIEEITGKDSRIIYNKNNFEQKTIRFVCSNTKESNESYSIKCLPESITIAADSLKGIFYGVQTLLQILQINKNKLPCFEIDDSPDFQHRGYYHDVTRGKVPKLETLKMLIEKAASYKINELQLYIEHSFAFKNIPELWIDKDPLTHDEIRELDDYCKKFYIDLIPSLASFGHLYELLRLKRFEHLNELEINASELKHDLWDRMAHYTIDPINPESLQLISSMIEEFLPLFSSKYFNICCDETFDLGKGKNASLVSDNGTGKLYVDFLKKIINIVVKYGKIPMFWGDIVLHYPELINEIPSNAIFLNWAYGADVTEDATATFQNTGVLQYVCPGVSGWSRFANDINSASQNIRKMINFGKKYSAIGVLNTDWGDCGHVNFISSSYHGMVLGASLSWNTESYQIDSEFDEIFSKLELNDSTASIARKIRELGSLCFYHFGNLYAWVNEKECLWLKEGALKEYSILKLHDNYNRADEILNELTEAVPLTFLAKIEYKEMFWSVRAIKWTIALLIFKKVVEYKQEGKLTLNKNELLQDCIQLCLDFKKLWRVRNKESEICNVVETFKGAFQKIALL